MFFKKITIAVSLFLLFGCSANQQVNPKLTLAEMESEASNTDDMNSTEEDPSQKQKESIEEHSEEEEPEDTKTEKQSSSGKIEEIKWDEFFDNQKQDTPSDKFWDLKGEKVVINGFMGEVLSLNGGWFLLIPEPGAECPFDNGDESYWNKIMIVFVEDKKELRFTNGPLKVTGRLDVGVKVDESNYKTMFRLYDAKFERINN